MSTPPPLSSLVTEIYPKYAESVKQNILTLLNIFPALIPSKKHYISNSGFECDLICLNGTVPVIFKGSEYNIPLTMWLPANFPLSPPLSYISPTSTMQINPTHAFVDKDGQCTLPYQLQWDHNIPKACSLLEMILEMCLLFGQNSPVYTKSSSSLPPSTIETHRTPPPKTLPLPPIPTKTSPKPNETYFNQTNSNNGNNNVITNNHKPTTTSTTPTTQQISQSLKEKLNDKLIQEYTDFCRKCTNEIDKELLVQSTSEKRRDEGLKAERDLISELENLCLEVDKVEQEIQNISYNIQTLSSQAANLPINDLIQPSTPHSHQLLHTVAEFHSIEDTLYHLEKGLQSNVITPEEYLKQVRLLSREQFTTLALTSKIKKEMGGSGVILTISIPNLPPITIKQPQPPSPCTPTQQPHSPHTPVHSPSALPFYNNNNHNNHNNHMMDISQSNGNPFVV